MKRCLMSSDVSWHIRDKLRPMPKHGSIILYVQETRRLIRTDSPGRPPRLSHSSWTMTNPLFKSDRQGNRNMGCQSHQLINLCYPKIKSLDIIGRLENPVGRHINFSSAGCMSYHCNLVSLHWDSSQRTFSRDDTPTRFSCSEQIVQTLNPTDTRPTVTALKAETECRGHV